MGTLDFSTDTEILNSIKQRLRRRGLKPDLDGEWEVHGPHQDMDYQVYIGFAEFIPDKDDVCICPKGSPLTNCPIHGFVCVAIYPWAVYEIEEPEKWWDVGPEDQIPIIEKE